MPSRGGTFVIVEPSRVTKLRYWMADRLMNLAGRLAIMPYVPGDTYDCACGDIKPYGFVPECGCPTHDPND